MARCCRLAFSPLHLIEIHDCRGHLAKWVVLILCVFGGVSHGQDQKWSSLGPGGGAIYALAINPGTPTTIYAGSHFGGIYKSIDGGNSWSFSGLTNLWVQALAIDPKTPATVYAGTWARGAYKSTDGGASWNAIGPGLERFGYDIKTLVIDPNTPTTIYASGSDGVYKSTDGGITWSSRITRGPALAIDPATPTTIYAGGLGLFKSTDGGANWTQIATDVLDFEWTTALAIDPVSPLTLYAGTSYGMYKSADGGTRWVRLRGIEDVFALLTGPPGQPNLYALTWGGRVYMTGDGGTTWSMLNSVQAGSGIQALAVHPTTPAVLYAGTYGDGVFRSNDGGNTWTSGNTGIINTWIGAVAIDPAMPTVLFAGTRHGLFKSTDSGKTWAVASKDLAGYSIGSVAFDPATSSTMYAVAGIPSYPDVFYNGTGNLYKSIDGGKTWEDMDIVAHVFGFTLVPTKPTTLYVITNYGAAKSTDGGTSWTGVTNGVQGQVRALAADPQTPTTLYAAAEYMYKSTDGGTSWTKLGWGNAETIAIDPSTPTTIYIGWYGNVYRSLNGGTDWADVTPYNNALGSGYEQCPSLAIAPTTPPTLYIGSQFGVYSTTDGAVTWNAVNVGLEGNKVQALAIHPATPTTLYAGTIGRGAFVGVQKEEPSIIYPRLAFKPGIAGKPDTTERTGIAVANLGSTSASLTFTAFDISGAVISGPDIQNPKNLELKAGEQLPVVDFELFGSGLATQARAGWIKLKGLVGKILGFFLMFNDNLTLLDGADVSSAALASSVLTEIDPLGFTEIHVVNPHAEPATVRLELVGQGLSTTRIIPANGAIAGALTDLFPEATIDEYIPYYYVRITSDLGVVSFELMGRPGKYVAGLNGQSALTTASTVYAPQYASGRGWSTTFSILNLSPRSGKLNFKLFKDDGTQVSPQNYYSFYIDSGGKYYISDPWFFLSPGEDFVQGYVEITSDGLGLAGSVIFGDPERNSFASALPLVSNPSTTLVLGQVASDSDYWTGIALVNKGDEDVTATIEVFDRQGTIIASKQENISKRQRKSQLLTQYFPSLVGREIHSGYIKVTSTRGLLGFALFGTKDALSAVPAQVVR